MDRWRILVIDDNKDTLDLLRMTLEEDYDVLTLANPVETPDMLEILEPDLIILDVMMPKVSGFQLIEYLKKTPAYKNIPVVFLTAKGAISDQKYGYTLGASLYLTKPFQPSRILKNIKLIFESQGQQRKAKRYSMREVELRLALQSSQAGGPDSAAREPFAKRPPRGDKTDEENHKVDPWLD